MTRNYRAVARLSVGAAILLLASAFLVTAAPDAMAAVGPFKSAASSGHSLYDLVIQASPLLLSLRNAATDLERQASAKLAEVNDGLDGAALRRIEDEHADIVNRLASTRAQISAIERAPHQDEAAIRNAAIATERERQNGIRAQARSARIPADDPFIVNLIETGRPLAEARNEIVNEWSKRQDGRTDNPAGGELPSGARVTGDNVDRWQTGVGEALAVRAGLVRGAEATRAMQGNEFAGMTLVEIARSALALRNQRPAPTRMDMVGQAFTLRNAGPGMHSTSDFGNVLGNVAQRSMMRGYTEVDETFQLWTGRGSLSDFRPTNRVDIGLFPALDKLEEGAEYKYGTFGDTGTMVMLATYGKLFAITRQAIINDDMGAFTRVPERMGRAAKRTIGNLVYAILNGNPTMQDGVTLFHANHGNIASVSGAPSVTTLANGMAAMQTQKDDSGVGTGGGIMPKFILTPPALWLPTNTALNSATIPGDSGQVENPVKGRFTAISDARLSGTAWYMAADPNQTDTIEVSYLDGIEEPFLDQRDGWNVDGTEFKVRMDAGVKALHWRGLSKNVGA